MLRKCGWLGVAAVAAWIGWHVYRGRCHSAVPQPAAPHGYRDDAVDIASEDSFPASDPPSWTAITRLGSGAGLYT